MKLVSHFLGASLVLLLVACVDVIPAELTDYLDERTVAEQVAFVNCSPLLFTISLQTTGTCEALNADSTLLQSAFPRWVSSCPACILVDEFGALQVGDLPAVIVLISAFGPNGSVGVSPSLTVVP